MDPAGSPAAALRAMIAGYEAAQTIYVAARLDLADLIARGMTSSRELAEATGSDEGALHRVLRALASLGVLRDVGDRRFELTERGRCLQAAAPGSVRAAALLAGERSYRAWGGLLHSVQSGQTAFEHVFGMGTFEYMAQNPAVRAIYDDAMSASSAVAGRRRRRSLRLLAVPRGRGRRRRPRNAAGGDPPGEPRRERGSCSSAPRSRPGSTGSSETPASARGARS